MKQPSQLRIKEHTKHKAWTKFKGMAQPFAIMKYMEVVKHFSNLAVQSPPNVGNRKTINRIVGDSPFPQPTNYSFIEDDEDYSDIIYEDDNGEEDTEDEEDEEDAEDEKNNSSEIFDRRMQKPRQDDIGFGMRQSTLANSIDLGHSKGLVDSDGDDCSVDEDAMTIMQAATYDKPARLRACINNAARSEGDNGYDDNRRTTDNDVNESDETGQTPLHMASDKGHVECVSILIEAGADVNATDDAGISILGAAVFGENVDVVKMLLEAGADPDKKDMDGDTPRSCAEEGDSEPIQELFRNL